MIRLEPTETGFQIDAADLGPLLEVAPENVQRLMRDGQITSRSEAGRDGDEGRHRITFRYGVTRLRLTVNSRGEVLMRSRITVAPRPGAPAGSDR